MKIKNTSQAAALASIHFGSRTSPPYWILVVEDDPFRRHLRAEGLIQHGYEVNAAENTEDGWKELLTHSYHLLITDHTPKVSGLDLLQKLPAARMGLPVIMASETFTMEEFMRAPWNQHPSARPLKPYTIDELLKTVRQVLGPDAQTRELIAHARNWQNQPSPIFGKYDNSLPRTV